MLNNHSNAPEIDVNELSSEEISIEELVNRYKKGLIKRNILCKVENSSKDIYINGTFEEDTWAIFRDLKKNYRYLDFTSLNIFQCKNISKEQKLLIKCWIAKRAIDNYVVFNEGDNSSAEGRTSERTVDNLNILTSFIIESDNFSLEFLDTTKGDKIQYFFDERTSGYTDSAIRKYIESVYEYLKFCLFTSNVSNDIFPEDIYSIYYERLSNLSKNITGNTKLTEDSKSNLPSGENILLFDYYINKFFDSDKTDELLKNYYSPIYIWWKLTNIIPIRISEFCTKIKRDCLFIKDDKYYLKIARAKKKVNQSKKGQLPILTDYQITKEFYDLISDYISKTDEDKYGITNTLLSYKSHLHFRAELAKTNPLFFSTNSKTENTRKYDDTYYSYDPLRILLNSFYDKIINQYFEDKLISERITLNDTRHFAFTSLVLQGIPLVEIAILGGHSDTNSIGDYTYDNNCYIDTQVFRTLNKSLSHYKVSKKNVYNIVFDMPAECPVPINECTETMFDDIILGFCTTQEELSCESYDCYNCSKWYCEPTRENFIKLSKIMQIDLSYRHKELYKNMEFLIKLFKNASFINSENPDTEVCLEHDFATQLDELSKLIQADTEEIIKIKSRLLEGITDVECSELEIIEKLKYLNKTFATDTKYLT